MLSSEEDEELDQTSSLPIGRACDRCRQRKIRCDRRTPCANCTTARIECNTAGIRPRQPRQRVLISSEYERKIDDIGNRLSTIEHTLQRLTTVVEQLATTNQTTSIQTSATSSVTHDPPDPQTPAMDGRSSHVKPQYAPTASASIVNLGNDSKVPTGDSSLLLHSQQARQLLEDHLRSRPSMLNNSEVVASRAQLQSAIQRGGTLRGLHAQVVPEVELPLPSWELVYKALQESRAGESLFFLIWTPFFTPDDFLTMCQELYTRPDHCSLPRKTLLYGCLYYMLFEWASSRQLQDPSSWRQIEVFRSNFEFSLHEHRALSIVADFEIILALVFGAGHAVQQGNFSQAWACNTLASRLCQSLEWHKAAVQGHSQSKKILFWGIYYLDHTLSLRLGRPSTIHDVDISVNLPEAPSDESHRAWSEWFRVLIDIARLHGLVYEKLYSPASFSLSNEQRASVAQDLDSWLHRVSADNANISHHPVRRQQHMSLLIKSNEVVIGCPLTLTHRAASTGQKDGQALHINDACLEAARATIRGHLDIVSNSSTQIGSSAIDYVHWRMLNCPSTPFLVLFSHVIFSSDQSDLDLLGAFVASLDNLASNLVVRQRESIVLFLQLCKPFYTLADHYVKASRQELDTTRKNQWPSDALDGCMPSYLNSDTLLDPNFSFLPPELFDAWLAGTQDLDLFNWPSIDLMTNV